MSTSARETFQAWFDLCCQPSVMRRGAKYAVVVGTVLITINHGDALARGEVDTPRLVRMGLTVMVPFFVSVLSSAGALRSAEARAEPPEGSGPA
ncbi:MAG: nitrate/nitrite transporter NrtS [Alphaproteobacteria bacterium]|nr:nitrate/nitrite transporter NrtS [Alphaproteobacteria bacterium]